ncbi:MAG: alpha-2-macroglobulin family protein [Myxococcota bacterium]
MKSVTFFCILLLIISIVFCGCGNSIDASTDLKVLEQRGLSDDGIAIKGTQPLPVVEYKAEKIFKKERWENISEPNVPEWSKVNRMVKEQKYEAAYSELEKLLKRFREEKEYERITHTLMKMVQIRMALHGYETAVNFLKSEEWPDGLYSQMVLNLYYAFSLVTYYNSYSWEINNREKVESLNGVDLKKLTKDDIYYEAQRAYLKVFSNREELSNVKIKSFSNYITPNTYPERIRGTLRDAISYLYTQLLDNTNLWKLEELNNVYTLPLEDMLQIKKVIVNLSDRDTHPLLKIVYILDDLSEWHRSNGETEAAFEAYLTKLEILYKRFTDLSDREKVRNSLETVLKKIETLEWWTEGMASLASMVMKEGKPDSYITAHRITIDCQKRFSGSIGAKRCLSIQKEIEAPAYSILGMNLDGKNRRSIAVNYKNLNRVYFRAYRMDFFSLLNKAKDYYLYPQYKQLDNIVFRNNPDFEWSEELPETKDYQMHTKYIVPPFKENGLYLIAVSARRGFPKSDNQIQAIYINISDMILETRNDYDNSIGVRVMSGDNGKPVQDAEVCLYRYDWQYGHKMEQCLKSDSSGLTHFINKGYQSNYYFIVARKGDDFTTDLQYSYFYGNVPKDITDRTLIFTDRSIYRPLQKVKWKIVHFHGDFSKGEYKVVTDRQLEVILYDYNHQVVEKKSVTTNEYGTASGEFTIPKGRILGEWTIGTSWGSQYIKVEEYKRPTFEVTLNKPESPLRLNKDAEITGEVKYYFGLPVATGTVRYVITRQAIFPYWWGYYSADYGYFHGYNRGAQTVASGTEILDKDGRFKVKFLPQADERFAKSDKGITYWYRVNVDVTDEGGETRSASQSYRVGFSSVEANINSDLKFFIAKEKENKFNIVRSGLNGEPKAGRAKYRIVSLKNPEKALMPAEMKREIPDFLKGSDYEKYRHSDDLIRGRWERDYSIDRILFGLKDDKEVKSGEIQHNEKGEYELDLSNLEPGLYKLYYETVDDFGEKYETQKTFIVADSSSRFNLPLIFYAQKNNYRVGEKARFLTISGLKDTVIYISRYQSGKTDKEEIVDTSLGSPIYEFKIEEYMRGGIVMTASLYNDYQVIQLNESISVPWDNKELKIEFLTFRDTLRPGERERFKIKVTAPDGVKNLSKITELLSYMYDKSLDYFTSHLYPNLLSTYPQKGFLGRIRSNLFTAHPDWVSCNGFNPLPSAPTLSPDYLKYYSGYGIGGVGYRKKTRTLYDNTKSGEEYEMADKALPGAAPPAKRSMERDKGDISPLAEKKPTLGSSAGGKVELERVTDSAVATKNNGDETSKGISEKPLEMRKDFSETAFFLPHLLLESDNTASIEFKAPDSVTSYNLFVHAITRDLMGGSVNKEVRVIKELMVRPYLPRFLREGDEAEIKVVVNNASDKEISGDLRFEIIDPSSEKSLNADFGLKDSDTNKSFNIKPKGSTNLSFAIRTPVKIDIVNVRVSARTKDFTDGELRQLPILPGRMHLIQSKFVVLKDKSTKVIKFDDLLRNDDPTLINDQMVVTLDAQLFFTILQSLPYLVNYPYECTEQTLNRFVSTAIVSSVYKNHPAIAKMAESFSNERDTRFEKWDTPDPNRKMLLEETPWLNMAKGGFEAKEDLTNVLNPEIANMERDRSLDKLRRAQTSIGGFPWFPGGPPSPYITLYILYGFSKAIEFGVDLPRDIILRGWQYLHQHYITEVFPYAKAHNCCWEFITFLNYVLSNYPDSSYYGGIFTPGEREEMLEFSFKHWKSHSPYLKGYLALTLERMKRHKDAVMVFESVMDSAKYSEDEGTHWAPEDRGWLWYNDSIETHAFAIRTLLEVMPEDKKLDGLVQWILMNKKLNHWKSTRATAEVIYSLIKYMKANKSLGIREEAKVIIGNDEYKFVFEPDKYTGKKNQILIPKEKINPETTSKITIDKVSRGFMFASATWHFSTEKLPDAERGDLFSISRSYFKREPTQKGYILKPLKEGAKIAVGDQIEVQISIKSRHPAEYVHLKDPRPAGCEPESTTSKHRWDLGIYWYEEVRDSAQNFFFENLPQGEYTFKYRLRANMAGRFKVAPATIQSMYAPEFNAYSKGETINIYQ